MALGAGLLFAVPGAAILAFFIWVMVAEARFDRTAREAEAEVTDTRITRGRRGSKDYGVKYTFRVPERKELFRNGDWLFPSRTDTWSSLEQEAYEEARTKRRLTVRYDPANPLRNRPYGEFRGLLGWWIALFPAALFLGLGAIGLRRGIRLRRAARGLA